MKNDLPQPMQVSVPGYFVPAELPPNQSRVWLRDVLERVRRHRALFCAGLALGLIGAAVVWLVSTPAYQATTLVKVVESRDSGDVVGDLASQFGGIAALAGVQLSGADNRVEVLAVLRSNSLAETFIRDHNLVPRLYAKQWNAAARSWRSPEKAPTMEMAIRRFNRQVRAVQEDKLTGLVKLSFRWHEREEAAQWAVEYVRLTNERMRRRAIDQANRSLAFLRKEAEQTDNVELRQAIFRLMQAQLKEATLANVQEEYALTIIDAARIPDEDDYIWPRPAALLVLGLTAGVLLGLIAVLLYRQRDQPDE